MSPFIKDLFYFQDRSGLFFTIKVVGTILDLDQPFNAYVRFVSVTQTISGDRDGILTISTVSKKWNQNLVAIVHVCYETKIA
jgi:hypothetical protein